MTSYLGNFRRAAGGSAFDDEDEPFETSSRHTAHGSALDVDDPFEPKTQQPRGYRSLYSASSSSSSSSGRVHRGYRAQHDRVPDSSFDRYVHYSRNSYTASGVRNRDPYADNREFDTYDHRSQSREALRQSAPEASGYFRGSQRYHSKRHGSAGKKVLYAVLGVIACCIVVGGIGFALWYNGILDNLSSDKDISNVTPSVANQPYYVLLLGGDSRDGTNEDNRSDSIMVARVDETKKEVSLVSVPRDLRVNMDEHGYQKINSAIEYGGYDYAIEIINNVLDIKINYYAFIYFDGFEELVDKLGGVTVDVPEGTYYNGVWVPAGEDVEIDGKEALVLARCRHGYPADQGAYAMGDYQRTLNQRNLIKAIGKKVLASDVTALPDLISGLSECVETNMGVDRIVSLATNLKGMDMDDLNAEQLPIASATIDGAWTAVMYRDVFEVLDENFKNGNDLMEGIEGFNKETNDDNIGYDYVDGPVYSYTMYEEHYGSFTSSTSSSTSSSSSSSGSSSSSSYASDD